MLDSFNIVTTGGEVVWSRTLTPVNHAIINNFITDVFIEEKAEFATARNGQSSALNPAYKSGQHTLRYAFVKEFGVMFIVRNTHYTLPSFNSKDRAMC